MATVVQGGLALLLYAAAVAGLTWPLAAHLTTHLPDTSVISPFDPLWSGWVLAWESHALATAPGELFHPNIYHPARDTLFYSSTAFGAVPYFMPVFLLTGNPILAQNLLFLGGVALTAWTLHLVVVRWTGSVLAAVVAAWTLLLTHWMLWGFLPTAPDEAVLFYLPLIVLLAARPAARFRDALPLLVLVALQSLTDVAYVAVPILVPLTLLGLARLVRRSTRAAGLRLLAVVALTLLFLSPIYAKHVAVRAANPGLQTQTHWPTEAAPVAPLTNAFVDGPLAFPVVVWVLVGVGALGAGVAAWRGRTRSERTPWVQGALWAVAGACMAFTPTVLWDDRSIALPHQMLARWLPVYDVLRVPVRLGVVGLIGVALLSGVAFAECVRRLPRGGLGASLRLGLALVLGTAMYRESLARELKPLPVPYPIAAGVRGDSALMRFLRQGRGPLLELPVGPDLGDPALQARAMYRSTYHWRPLLNGYSSYWPAGFQERMAVARELPDRAALARLRREAGLEMILVHVGDIGVSERLVRELCDYLVEQLGAVVENCPPDTHAAEREAWLALAETGRGDLRLVARDGEDLLFAVTGDPAAIP
jgi:hypothetical protein